MSDFNLTSDEKHLLAIMFNQLSREVQPIQETAEDRWEFDQQSEALYQARLEAIKPPISPSPDGQEALLTPRQSGDFIPYVSTETGD